MSILNVSGAAGQDCDTMCLCNVDVQPTVCVWETVCTQAHTSIFADKTRAPWRRLYLHSYPRGWVPPLCWWTSTSWWESQSSPSHLCTSGTSWPGPPEERRQAAGEIAVSEKPFQTSLKGPFCPVISEESRHMWLYCSPVELVYQPALRAKMLILSAVLCRLALLWLQETKTPL